MTRVTKQGTFNVLAWLTGAMAVFGLGAVVYALAFENPYLSYHNLPFPTATVQSVAGQPTPLIVERCNNTKKIQNYETTRRLTHIPAIGETKRDDVILQSEKVDIKAGCHRATSKLSTPPADTIPGTYMWSGLAQVKGLLRVHEVEWYSEPFEIVAPESKK